MQLINPNALLKYDRLFCDNINNANIVTKNSYIFNSWNMKQNTYYNFKFRSNYWNSYLTSIIYS